MSFDLNEYVDVAERIHSFYERFPDGRLVTSHWEQLEVGDKSFILCWAKAYRSADDLLPGDGLAWEPIPGPTQFTRDSELMNAQTAAWGRAIVALGFDTKKIASRQEVQARTDTPFKAPDPQGLQESRADAVHVTGEAASVVLTFGKHKGKPIRDVPEAYLTWWVGQEAPKTEDLLRQRSAVEEYLQVGEGLIATPVDPDADIPF